MIHCICSWNQEELSGSDPSGHTFSILITKTVLDSMIENQDSENNYENRNKCLLYLKKMWANGIQLINANRKGEETHGGINLCVFINQDENFSKKPWRRKHYRKQRPGACKWYHRSIASTYAVGTIYSKTDSGIFIFVKQIENTVPQVKSEFAAPVMPMVYFTYSN